jgi:hypothetical protein
MILNGDFDMKHVLRQPQRLGAERRETEKAAVSEMEEINLHGRALEKCPECGGTLIREGGCMTCMACGWNACLACGFPCYNWGEIAVWERSRS